MGLNLADLRLSIYRPLGLVDSTNTLIVSQLPLIQADLYLNRAFWEIQNKFPFREKEIISEFDTVDDVRNYNVTFPTEAIIHLSIEDDRYDGNNNPHAPLERITRDVYEQSYRNDTDENGFPTKYVLEGCVIRLYPTPDGIYKIIMKRLVTLTDLSLTNATPGIPQVWHEIIGYGALWRAFIDRNDYARANNIKMLQAELINTIIPREALEDQSNAQLARVEVLGIDYEQVDWYYR